MDDQNNSVISDLEKFVFMMQHSNLVHCAIPGCTWNLQFIGLTDINKCFVSFREHCVEQHQLDPNDMEAVLSIDTGEWVMHVY
jgi:hypothetical protein